MKAELRVIHTRIDELYTFEISKRSYAESSNILTYQKFCDLYQSKIKFPLAESQSFNDFEDLLKEDENFPKDLVSLIVILINLKIQNILLYKI